MRRRKKQILPDELEDDELIRLDEPEKDVDRKLLPVIVKVQLIGKFGGAKSLGASAALVGGSILSSAVLSARFADAWRRRVMRAVIDGSSNPASEAALAMGSRLDSIAVTESAREFNRERQRIAEQYQPSDGRVLVKRWDAQLDACDFCWSQNGTIVLVTDSFPGGEPGFAHPRCQCVCHYEEISIREYYTLAA